ncbi:hypothetical protein KIH07_24255 [Hydrogenophaga taeniospiralis]|uniref:Kelch repeat-containing protein n=1 Tax=Hydrogenophaga taeniospiralis TaxID=65656 RepID=UPI001CFB276D|nr:kelch repeat-containing protein [Hydrogenophaga taeniospiralis]MCB4366862.1 hypothetical protein [Hydrogenophaga taeniospiralis]
MGLHADVNSAQLKRLDRKLLDRAPRWRDVIYGFGGGRGGGVSGWSAGPALTQPRWQTQGLAVGGKIWAIGGYYESGLCADIEIYDPATGTWTVLANPFSGWGQTFAVASNGKVYAMGGLASCLTLAGTVEEYDPASAVLTPMANIPVSTYQPGIAASATGKIYVVGGCVPPTELNGMVGPPSYLDILQVYDTQSGAWTIKRSMPTQRFGLAAVFGADGKLYAMGGHGPDGHPVAEVHVYDPATDMWTSCAPLPSPRYHVVGVRAASTGRIFAIGGLNVLAGLTGVDEFDPVTNTWSARNGLVQGRWFHGAAALGDTIYVMGGSTRIGDYVPDNSNIQVLASVEVATAI